MDKNKVGTMMQSAAKVPISELNECITCKLCRGYFINATTIIECLHTFCRSCIVRYLESNKYCPICDVQVHKTKPLLNLRPDKTIQNLVYKLVPRLYQNEIQRRKSFYETHPEGKPTATEQATESQYDYILAPEESVNLILNYHGCCTSPRYLRCPSAVLVMHLKKLIRSKYELTEHHRVDVFYNQDCLNPSFSLMDISYIYSWKRKDPLDLTYKIYECRAKKPKLENTEKSENIVNNSANNNNNNWKEVQLRISENGEMSITGIEDSSMLELLDATENFKSEIVINEGKNLENFPKPIQVDTEIGNSEIRIQSNHSLSVNSHVKTSENAPSGKKQENAQKPLENHLVTSKKELPGLKMIGKSSASSCTTSTLTSTKLSCVGTKVANSSVKVMTSGTKTGNSTLKSTNNSSKSNVESKKGPSTATSSIEASKTSTSVSTTKSSGSKQTKAPTENKFPKNSIAMPKSMELSATLNLNSELSVIPLSASTSCVSLSSCGGTTTVFSTINRGMGSTRMESRDDHNSMGGEGKSQGPIVNSNEGHSELENETVVNNIPKETKNLKRKCEEDRKTPEVPAKLPKPTILNHSIGLMNLSNNHPLKKHSKMNRNGEHLLRAPEISEKVPISTPSLTVNHVTVPQKPIAMDSSPSKPIIINKNVSTLQISRPGTPKSGQRGGQGGNVPCYANKTLFNSVGGKLGERNGEKMESTQGKTEVLNATVNSIAKTPVHHLVHHTQSYQTSHHTPIITPSQLPHHQNLNSLHVKSPVCSVSTHTQEEKKLQGNVTSQSSVTSHVSTPTSQSNVASSQGSMATLHSNMMSIAASHPTVTSQSNVTLTSQGNVTIISQKRIDSSLESFQTSNKSLAHTTPHSAATNHSIHINTISTTSSSIQNPPLSQAPPTTVTVLANHAPVAIKTKPSTPIGYKTLRDPPKSWNSQINSQIARVNQNVKAQQLANAAAAASQGGGVNAQGRYTGDLKSVRPAKFFKGRNMPRYLGCPASGVKPMYQLQTDKEKASEQQAAQTTKSEKSEIKKHSIVKIDPKTLRPISEKAPETSNLSNISSNLGLNTSQSNQELRINSTPGDLKINTSSVSIFNPLKLQSSPKSERKSPKSPHSPKVKSSPNSNSTSAATTSTTASSPSPSNTLSPKQHRDKTNLTFTPPNPFVPNLTSPTLSPNQFLYPAGGFPSYDPRVMAAYHSLWYTQRMAAAAAAGFVPPPMPHAFGMNIGLNTGTTTIGQQHNPGISPKHSTPPKSSGQSSPRTNSLTSTQISKSSPTPPKKKTKDVTAKNEKSLETALSKLSQNKANKELGGNKLLGNSKQQQSASKKMVVMGGGKELISENSMPVDAQRSSSPKVLGGAKLSGGHNNSLADPQQRLSSKGSSACKKLGANNKELGGNNLALPDAQQSKVSPKDPGRSNSAMSALEKLSHNKAIEILGGDVSGKKSPVVREIGGRNSPMGLAKSGSCGNRLPDGNEETFKGTSTPSLKEKQFPSSEATKRQSSSSESNTVQQTSLGKNSEPSTSSQTSQITHHKMEGDKNTSTQKSTLSEQKTESSELQTRLEQSPEESSDQNSTEKGEKRVQKEDRADQNQIRSDQVQNKSDLGENRLGQDQSRSTQSYTGSSGANQSVSTETVKNTVEGAVSTCEGELKDATNDPKTTSSDKTAKVETDNDRKQSVLDSSDIRHSSAQNCVGKSPNSSVKNTVNESGGCDSAATGEAAGNVASQTSGSNGAGGDSGVPVTLGNSEGSEIPVVKNNTVEDVARDKSGDIENKSNDVMEGDKGGGEKK